MGEKNLWNMELFEDYNIDSSAYLTRVPGGWIFTSWSTETRSTSFIPYHDEFNPDKKPCDGGLASDYKPFSESALKDGDIGLVGSKDKLFDTDKKASLAHGGIDNVAPKDWDAVAKDLYGN